jgi:cyclic beta-1,2-glucan synthetase
MAALDRLLVRRDARLIELFTPPFEHTPLDPGYIKGYPPGIRENGGQYTHGAVWAVIASAILGDGDRAAELLAMLNPISHSASATAIARYQVEPYVACADVYTAPDKLGRGGWTWYTGTAGWLYRAALEWLLGVSVRGATLRLDPCIPKSWPGFDISLRYRSARYLIAVENPNAVCRGVSLAELDGAALRQAADPIPLSDDGTTHRVRIVLG